MCKINIHSIINPSTFTKYSIYKLLYSLSSYFRDSPNSTVSDINNLICHLNLTYVFQFLIVLSPVCMMFHMFFLQNL